MYGIKTTQKQLVEMVHNLAMQGLCNEKALGSKEWFSRREGQDYTPIAYSKGMYGVIAEIYYLKGEKVFCYV